MEMKPTVRSLRGAEKDLDGAAAARWPAALAVLAAAGLYALLPEQLRVGPSWGLVVLLIPLLLALPVLRSRGLARSTRVAGVVIVALLTVAVWAGAASLVLRLSSKDQDAVILLRNGVLLWVANMLTFALWYWEIDSGGPAARRREFKGSSDFVFPQMVQGIVGWHPEFVDYLFLAFNTSTAFSPSDTMILSRRMKVCMMAQSVVSLVVVVVLVARAVGTL